MSWDDYALARRVLTEEGPGRAVRQLEAGEDSEHQATMKALRGA